MPRAKLLIVDDDRDLLATLSEWCRREGFEVDAAGTGEEAIRALTRHSYDAIVLDLVMPEVSGMQILAITRNLQSNAQVVIHTANPSMNTAIEALRAGKAYDYLIKPLGDLRDLTAVLVAALQARSGPSPSPVAGTLPETACPVAPLTPSEADVARLLVQGMATKEIAETLGFTEGTIRNRLSRIYSKLGATHRGKAIALLGGIVDG